MSLNDLMSQVQSNLSDEIARPNGQLRVGDLPAIEAEPYQMVQLFQNLVANALKYSDRPPEINVYAEEGRSQQCTIYVVDNGIGFEPKYLDKFFSPFQRLHGRETYDGTEWGSPYAARSPSATRGHHRHQQAERGLGVHRHAAV